MIMLISELAPRRHSDVVMASLYTSQQRRRYVSNETPNDVPVECHQDVPVVRLHNVLLECCGNISRGCNDDVPSVGFHNVSPKSHMKQLMTS